MFSRTYRIKLAKCHLFLSHNYSFILRTMEIHTREKNVNYKKNINVYNMVRLIIQMKI